MAWNAIGSGLCLQRSRLIATKLINGLPSHSHPIFSPPSLLPLLPAQPTTMKYRSPSPESSLPTPPQSPRSVEATQSAIILLDSLTSFYQQERYWVHHTRAALELALSKGIDAPPTKLSMVASPSDVLSASLSMPTPLTISSPVDVSTDETTPPVVKIEPTSPEDTLSAAHTKWMRRKNILKLKLDGIASHSKRRRPHRAPHTEPGAHLLEMFSELVDARMESCQRISRLVRDANQREFLMC